LTKSVLELEDIKSQLLETVETRVMERQLEDENQHTDHSYQSLYRLWARKCFPNSYASRGAIIMLLDASSIVCFYGDVKRFVLRELEDEYILMLELCYDEGPNRCDQPTALFILNRRLIWPYNEKLRRQKARTKMDGGRQGNVLINK
ncbi:hypothetical protein DICVIV_14154, partial [Dictyocaulus viviparus]